MRSLGCALTPRVVLKKGERLDTMADRYSRKDGVKRHRRQPPTSQGALAATRNRRPGADPFLLPPGGAGPPDSFEISGLQNPEAVLLL